ncbi:hypothetical protein AAVH_14799 [Aphelenchoides avenae]|nr:hypothetical protein AAVH_14799 [Aphelenchus avenae]
MKSSAGDAVGIMANTDDVFQLRYVPCTQHFFDMVDNLTSEYYSDYPPMASGAVEDGVVDDTKSLADVIYRSGLPRFLISSISVVPLLVCLVLSFNRKIESFPMRMFCWNCVFVNVFCVVFLGCRALADSLFPPVDVCLYDEYGDPDALRERPRIWLHFNDYLFDELAKWTIYATSVPLVMVRFSAKLGGCRTALG